MTTSMDDDDFEWDEKTPGGLTLSVGVTVEDDHMDAFADIDTTNLVQHVHPSLPEPWMEEMNSFQNDIKLPRRYRASPAPSSNTSVVASDGEEDEGYDDIEIPDELPNVFGAGNQVSNGIKGQVESNKILTPVSKTSWHDSSESLVDDIEIPDDFTWKRRPPEMDERLKNFRHPNGENGENDNNMQPPSKIPVLKKLPSPSTRKMDVSTFSLQPRYDKGPMGISPAPQIQRLTMTSQNYFGDGTELDDLEEFLISPEPATKTAQKSQTVGKDLDEERSFQRAGVLFGGTARANTPGALRQTSTFKRNTKPKRKPTLISKSSVDMSKSIGGMTFNPALQQWEGNEEVLLEFDKATSISRLKPALITHHGFSKHLPQVVGSMFFDPLNMKWIGNEEEDVFADLDEENLSESTAKSGTM
ncbi:hypothetical protein HDU97_005615 [Phlyctochytrium planicorne]|nr:hypothetical protein HDU97_005615 [Phlyctochytrium planicorne]